MSPIELFLRWSIKHQRKFVAIAVASFILPLFLGTQLLLFMGVSKPSPPPMGYAGGFQRIYPRVREADDYFARRDYAHALILYEEAEKQLWILQEDFPERRITYRDAERIVKTRIHFAEAAKALSSMNSRLHKD